MARVSRAIIRFLVSRGWLYDYEAPALERALKDVSREVILARPAKPAKVVSVKKPKWNEKIKRQRESPGQGKKDLPVARSQTAKGKTRSRPVGGYRHKG